MADQKPIDLKNTEDLEKRLVVYKQGDGLTITPIYGDGYTDGRLFFVYDEDDRKFYKNASDAFIRNPIRRNFERVRSVRSVIKFFSSKDLVDLAGVDPNGDHYKRIEDFARIKEFYFLKDSNSTN